MPPRYPSPYLRFRQNPRTLKILQLLRHRPFLCAGIFLVTTVFLWKAGPHEYLSKSFTGDQFAFPTNTPTKVWSQRAEHVKTAFLHAYHGYEQIAAPHDELTPLSSGFSDECVNCPLIAGVLNSVNRFNGWGVTTIDSLDTMLLMKLDGEYSRALKLVSEMHFLMPSSEFAPFFETVIRYLGGLLSGYAISKDRVLLARAEELADKLDPVFNKYGGMFPVFGVNTDSCVSSLASFLLLKRRLQQGSCWAPDRSFSGDGKSPSRVPVLGQSNGRETLL